MYSTLPLGYHPLMRIALDTLPTDITLLHQLVRDMADGIDSRDSALSEQRLASWRRRLTVS